MLQLGFQRRPTRAQRQLPDIPLRGFTVHGSTVFNDVRIMKPSFCAKATHLLRRFTGARNHRNPALLQLADQILCGRPVVGVIQQRAAVNRILLRLE